MEGLVLRLIDYGESDQIAYLFLKEEGILSAIAKGIKKSKHRFPHHLEPFRIYSFKLRKKPSHDLYWIQTADQVTSFEKIMNDIRKIALGNVIFEMVMKGVREGHPHPELYTFVISLFRALEVTDNIFPLRFYAEIHTLRLLGFLPNFETCLRCRKPLRKEEDNCFDPVKGGIICPRCQGLTYKTGTIIGSEALGALQFLKKSPLHAVSRLRITENAKNAIEAFLTEFITYHLEHPIKSLSFLKEVMP